MVSSAEVKPLSIKVVWFTQLTVWMWCVLFLFTEMKQNNEWDILHIFMNIKWTWLDRYFHALYKKGKRLTQSLLPKDHIPLAWTWYKIDIPPACRSVQERSRNNHCGHPFSIRLLSRHVCLLLFSLVIAVGVAHAHSRSDSGGWRKREKWQLRTCSC